MNTEKQPKISNCYYCEKPFMPAQLKRKEKGNAMILDCGKCKSKKYVRLIRRKVESCLQA